jgi:hypothetical protein
MNWIRNEHLGKESPKTSKELRKFGLIMAIPLLVITGILYWRQKPAMPYFLTVAIFFLLSGLLIPKILAPVEKIWMRIAEFLSIIMTKVILTLTFYVVITPVGLFLRLSGKDILEKRIEPNQTSYWVPVEPDGPCSRPEKPY